MQDLLDLLQAKVDSFINSTDPEEIKIFNKFYFVLSEALYINASNRVTTQYNAALSKMLSVKSMNDNPRVADILFFRERVKDVGISAKNREKFSDMNNHFQHQLNLDDLKRKTNIKSVRASQKKLAENSHLPSIYAMAKLHAESKGFFFGRPDKIPEALRSYHQILKLANKGTTKEIAEKYHLKENEVETMQAEAREFINRIASGKSSKEAKLAKEIQQQIPVKETTRNSTATIVTVMNFDAAGNPIPSEPSAEPVAKKVESDKKNEEKEKDDFVIVERPGSTRSPGH